VEAGVKSFSSGGFASYTMPTLPSEPAPPRGPFVGQYQLFKLDNRPFDGYRYEVRGRHQAVLASGLSDASGKVPIVSTDDPTMIRAYKSVMRETERITENWQSKVEQAAAKVLR
jgi:type VI secretion system secreted protein VgrG